MIESTLRNKNISNEDKQTSTIIGLLKYLPSKTLWHIIRNSCCDSSNLPKNVGDLLDIEFWPRWNSDNTTNERYIEPDVYMRFESFNIIIEAKLSDNFGQYENQWKNQITAYLNEEEEASNLIYISLGGNLNKNNEKIKILIDSTKFEVVIYKCNWIGIFLECKKALENLHKIETPLPTSNNTISILIDVLRGFSLFGYYDIKWFENMRTDTIELETIKLFKQ